MLLEKLAEENRSSSLVAAEFDKIPSGGQSALGLAKDFGGFGGGDLVVHLGVIISQTDNFVENMAKNRNYY